MTKSSQISAEQTLLYLVSDRQLKDDHDARAIGWIRGYNPWWKMTADGAHSSGWMYRKGAFGRGYLTLAYRRMRGENRILH